MLTHQRKISGRLDRRRGRGDGTIRQRPNGLWEASLRYVDPLTDLPERASFYGPSREAVVAKLDAARDRLRGRRPARDEGIPLSAFLAAWLEDVVKPTKRPATYRSYKICIEQHLAKSRIGAVHLRDLREVQIQHVLVARAKAGATRTQQLSLIVLKAALEQAVKWGFLEANPCEGITVPKLPRREVRALSAEEARRFLACARGDKLFALYWLALDTGLRQGELLALEWRDVDLEAGTLRVVRSLDNHSGKVGPVKTRASRRMLELGPATIAILRAAESRTSASRSRFAGVRTGQGGRTPTPKARRASRETPAKLVLQASSPLVFPNRRGGHLSPQNIRNRSFLPLQLAAGIDPPIRFHDLRHTAATLMLAAGIHPKIVSERLGHATIAITMDTYQHVTPSMQREVAGRVGELLGGINGGTGRKPAKRAASRGKQKPR